MEGLAPFVSPYADMAETEEGGIVEGYRALKIRDAN
jgi:hypothetical protein